MTWQRGFRRIGWVVIALAVPAISLLAYGASEVLAGYEPRLLTSGFPTHDSMYQSVEVGDVGVFHFPGWMSDTDLQKHMKAVHAKALLLTLPNADRRRTIVVCDQEPSAITSYDEWGHPSRTLHTPRSRS